MDLQNSVTFASKVCIAGRGSGGHTVFDGARSVGVGTRPFMHRPHNTREATASSPILPPQTELNTKPMHHASTREPARITPPAQTNLEQGIIHVSGGHANTKAAAVNNGFVGIGTAFSTSRAASRVSSTQSQSSPSPGGIDVVSTPLARRPCTPPASWPPFRGARTAPPGVAAKTDNKKRVLRNQSRNTSETL